MLFRINNTILATVIDNPKRKEDKKKETPKRGKFDLSEAKKPLQKRSEYSNIFNSIVQLGRLKRSRTVNKF